ncbi:MULTISPECIES: hypothetical protein [unclassified Exiguobacterium]|uniref:hypothetical protein n=1 Tax=unclassified Exiguobacterium TaxID=2644629 RepID=UPI001BE8A4BD|nr:MULTISPECIES: hypothetical protein [unclassified Exiguobacterium]
MGVWGVAILSNDLAEDIRFSYKDLLGDGYSNEQASERVIQEHIDELDDEEMILFWLSFALIQWKLGRLQDHVKQNAVEIIDSGIELENWNDDLKLKKKREAVLLKLKHQLNQPQPLAKKIPKRFVANTTFKSGDIVSFQMDSSEYILLKVIDIIEQWTRDRYPLFEIYDWQGKEIPSLDEISTLRLKTEPYDDDEDMPRKIAVYQSGKRDPFVKRASLIAEGFPVTSDTEPPYTLLSWKGLNAFICDMHLNGNET